MSGRPDPLLLEEMTWPEVRDAAAAGLPVVLPVGATEQHGPHLPLNTDCLIPVGIAREVAKRVSLVIAPPIRFGAKSRPLSGGGESFPGTISLSGHTMIDTLHDVLSALARSGFERLCLQNWHFENSGYLWEAADLTAREHPGIRIVVLDKPLPEFTPAQLVELFPAGFPGWSYEHAASMETSLMLALHPELVRTDRIADDAAERKPTWEVVPPPPEIIAQSGVLWRPSEGTAEIGRLYLTAAAERLESALRTEFAL
ncbi:MAG TPA: creatininase [Gaiellaceae bacterium]|nr:creatininase [Gaiellaceae bacterium]